MKTRFILLVSVSLFAANAWSQTGNAPRPDGFRGLILNQTSTEDAIRVLGQPAGDRVDRLNVSKLSKWLDLKYKEKIFRQLDFKNVGDFSRIGLSFLENKLMMIELDFKKNLSPFKIDSLFAVEFAVVGVQGGTFDLPNEPGKYPVRFLPTLYPFTYGMIGVSDKAFIWVDCSTVDARIAGKVDSTRQISRVLERK
jgi:hypothetical protein